jgi:hypothetical protein
MLEICYQRVNEDEWRNAEVKVVNAQDTCLPTEHHTHVFTAFSESKR